MDFSNRSQQPVANAGSQPLANPVAVRHNNKSTGSKKDMWGRIGVVTGFVALAALLVGLIIVVYANNNNNKDIESKYIYSNKLQAVFLNTGQVYFGNIETLNNNFLRLTNIFYLQTSSGSSTTTSSSSSNNVTLVKLGCELHMPYDQMLINRSQVTFWENLQSDGQVAKAVSTWDSEHPNGQQCTDQSSSSANTSSTVQNAGSKQ